MIHLTMMDKKSFLGVTCCYYYLDNSPHSCYSTLYFGQFSTVLVTDKQYRPLKPSSCCLQFLHVYIFLNYSYTMEDLIDKPEKGMSLWVFKLATHINIL